MMYSMNETFILSTNCSYIYDNQCSVNIVFWYERGYYVVNFPGNLLSDEDIDNTRQFIMIETVHERFFSYDINHLCKEKDDCARYFAEMKINEMTQRSFHISNLYYDLKKILHKKSNINEDLFCFDTNEIIRQCLIEGMIGSCEIIDNLTKNKIHRRTCKRRTQESASVNIYDSGDIAMMTINCNRILCNGPVTIEAVKNVLYYYNITDINGRLLGKSSNLSLKYYFNILILCLIFFI